MKKLAALTALLMSLLTTTASAHPVTHLIYKDSIDGSDALGVSEPTFSEPRLVAMDQDNQILYVASESKRIYKINAQTYAAAQFTALSGTEPTTVITGQPVGELGNFAVDNSDGATQGRIYAFGRFAFPSGNGVPALYYPSGTKATPAEFSITKTGGNFASVCGIEVAPSGNIWFQQLFNVGGLREYPSSGGTETGRVINPGETEGTCGQFAIDSQENFYQAEYECCSFVRKFNAAGEFQYSLGTGNSRSVTADRSDDSVFVNDSSFITKYSVDGQLLDKFGQAEEYAPGQHYAGLSESPALVVNEPTEEVFAVNPGTSSIDVFAPGPPKTAADVAIQVVPTLTDAALKGTVNPDGVTTTDCYFEWGETRQYGNKVDCTEGDVFTGSSDHAVSAEIPISVGQEYHARLVVKNEEGLLSFSGDQEFNAQEPPVIERLFVNEVNTESVRLNARINPGQGEVGYRFEYGPDTNYGTSVPDPDGTIAAQFFPRNVDEAIQGLNPGSTYHYRVVAVNLAGSDEYVGTFTTFPRISILIDKCANALSRQQTGAALLPDCRAYELASAADTGGYDVESDLVPGQEPFAGHPAVEGELLYGTHNGGIPGVGSPTNLGVDPYVAVRGEDGWTTRYVGIPADGTPSAIPFSSNLLAADQDLDTFAFGPDVCAPCFPDGSSGIPVRRQDKDLAQGMAGPEDPGSTAKPDGLVSKPLSADGSHLIFGSLSQFHEDGNDETGDVSIYDRNLDTGTTQVVSTNPSGNPLDCPQGPGTCHSPGNADGIAQLDLSSDGSRVLVAQKLATDSDGNVYWHPYMHVGSDSHSIDLAPGTTAGVLYDGMTEDGSKVFFTTRDKLASGDTDSSADIYLAEVGSSGPVTPQLLSTMSDGDPSNTDACSPVIEWNTVEPGPNCDATALAGGAGVAPGAGTFFFLSPEQLDGTGGEADQANLYIVKPGGHPHFVATIDSSETKPGPAPPTRPVANEPLITGIQRPRALAVNDVTGDIYVEDAQKEVIQRFTKSGDPHPFTEGASAGTNELLKSDGESPVNGLDPTVPGMDQIAVDNHPGSLLQGAVYVASASQFDLSVFSADGAQLGDIKGISGVCGVSVEKSSGDVYVGATAGSIWRLHLVSGALPLSIANYEVTKINTGGGKTNRPCHTGADSIGNVYAVNCGGFCNYQANPVNRFFLSVFDNSSFASPPGPNISGEFISGDIQAFVVDSESNELFLDFGGQVNVLGPFGELREIIAKGEVKNSEGIAINGATHHIYLSSGNTVVEVGYEADPSKPIDNPTVVHAVHEAGVHRSGDFQVSSDGRFTAFPSGAKITDQDSFGKLQVYRYDAQADSLICASCSPTNSAPSHNASLARHGNSLTADGRVFFNSSDALALRDTNGNLDAYEWSGGDVDLISAGTGPFDSGLASVSTSGRDAYFFTRDRLAPGDQNGSLMRIYDARAEGGFFHVPPPPPCAASDECHGPGSQAAPPAEIGSLGGTGGNLTVKKPHCRRGFVRKRGKCVRKTRRGHARSGQRRTGR